MPYRQNLDTGEWIEVDAQGNPLGAQPQGQVFTLPPDPVEQARLANEQERIEIARNNSANSNANADLKRSLLEAQVRAAQAAAAKAEKGTAGAATGDAKLQARVANMNALVEQINRVQELYESGPGATDGIWGLQDYFPTEKNRQFDAAAAGLAEQGLAAFRVPGVGAQSDTELRQFVEANKPSAGDYDAQISEKLRQLRSRVDQTRATMGLPAAQWQGANDRANAMTYLRTDGGANPPPSAADFGATQRSVPYPEEGQREHDALVQRLLATNGGRLDPQAYAAAASELDRKYGLQPNPEALAGWAGQINQYLDNGGKTIPTGIQPSVEDMSAGEQFRNNIVNNPVGAGAVGYLDSMTLGAPTAAFGDQMSALGDSQGLPMALGQIGGALTGTAAIGKLGSAIAGKVAPKLLGGAGKAQFGRNMAVDATYGAGYGGVTEGDPLGGAALGTLGSAGGQAVGSGLGRAIGGIDLAPAVSKLRATGIPLTAGQTLGGMAKSIEDKATSLPFVGDMINARRLDGLRAFNEQAFDEAGKPIGARVGAIGNDGTQALFDQVGDAYDSATQGVRIPLDPDFVGDMAVAESRASLLPDDLKAKYDKAIQNRVWAVSDQGEITGESYQQAQRGLKSYKAEAVKPGFEADYRDALSSAQDALKGQMLRGGGRRVVEDLGKADAAYRNIKMLEDAVGRAKGGSMSGETFTFTPSQLQSAVAKSGKKFPGKTPLEDLANTGQEVLPSKVPDSGTAGRLANMAPLGLIGAGGAGGYALDGSGGAATGAGTSAALTALLILGGTKAGQKAITAALADRPAPLSTFGRKLRSKKGLFGHAAQPFALEGL